MVYSLSIDIPSKNKEIAVHKQLYLSADNDNQVIKRCSETYRVAKEYISILERINDRDINIGISYDNDIEEEIVKKEESTTKVVKQKSKSKPTIKANFKAIARDLLKGSIIGISKENIQSKVDKGWTCIKLAKLDEEELLPIVEDYSKIKIYYIKENKRKNKNYICLCKIK